MKRMLINATQEEELRVALVDGQYLYDLDIESPGHEQKKANIYKGKITAILPSLEAAFVDYGTNKPGFLPLKEISREYFPKDYTFNGRPNIKDVLKVDQEVIVQIEKEERGEKGAALTTFISLAGSYLVLMPNNPRAEGISRRIEGEDRAELKEIMRQLQQPEGMGVIIRTAGLGKSIEALQWDLEFRLKHWEAIKEVAASRPAPFLIHQESNVIVRAFRDYLQPDIGEILIDNAELFKRAKEHVSALGRPDFSHKIKLYEGEVPLFSHFQIESQIKSAFEREVSLPSGGSIVIDSTEALTAIDINSARSTRGGDIEETAFNTNLEAADEIARQLRLRDLGGLIVIDFIDMIQIRHQRDIETRLRNAVRQDRARIQISKISRFGLLEMSRQRLSPSLGESSHHVCPRCSGTGIIRDDESLSLSILRLIEEYALKDNTSQVFARVPVTIAAYLLNSKRDAIKHIEQRQKIQVIVDPDKDLQTPHYEVDRRRVGEEAYIPSYLRQHDDSVITQADATEKVTPEKEVPALSTYAIEPTTSISESLIQQSKKISEHATKAKEGLMAGLVRFVKSLFSKVEEKEEEKPARRSHNDRRNQGDRRSSQRRGRDNRDRDSRDSREGRDGRSQRDNRNNGKSSRRDRNERNERIERKGPEEQQVELKEVATTVTSERPNKRRERNNRRNDDRRREQQATAVVEETTVQQEPTSEVETQQPAQVAKEERAPRIRERRARRELTQKIRIDDNRETAVEPQLSADESVKTPLTTDVEQKVTEVVPAKDEREPRRARATSKQSPVEVVAEQTLESTPSETEKSSSEAKNGNDEPPRRSRRSPRHLRVSGQRRRRYRDDSYPTQSAMPLELAVASPELASGKIVIRYDLLKSNNTNPTVIPVEEMLASMEQGKQPIPTEAPQVSQTETVKSDVAPIAPVEEPVVKTAEEHSDAATQAQAPQAVPLEHVVAKTETVAEVESITEVSVADTTAKHSAATVIKGSAYAPMTKAPAPEMETTQHEVVISVAEPEYHFVGRGRAGATAATHHASSDAAKPTGF